MHAETHRTESVEDVVDKVLGTVVQVAERQKLSPISSEEDLQKKHQSEPLGMFFNTNFDRDNRSRQLIPIGQRGSFGAFIDLQLNEAVVE